MAIAGESEELSSAGKCWKVAVSSMEKLALFTILDGTFLTNFGTLLTLCKWHENCHVGSCTGNHIAGKKAALDLHLG